MVYVHEYFVHFVFSIAFWSIGGFDFQNFHFKGKSLVGICLDHT